MFDGADFNKSLDEELFDTWLENGRESKLNYTYLLIIWDELESEYRPVYVEGRKEIHEYIPLPGRELLVAAYDLYSESRIV
jgi:hypothetical protein